MISSYRTNRRAANAQGGVRVLTSMRRMSIDRTVVKKNICRKKSDTSPTTANRQNSYEIQEPVSDRCRDVQHEPAAANRTCSGSG